MKNFTRLAALLLIAAAPRAAAAQDGPKWKPYQFKGNERFEYKMVMTEGEEKKESGYILDIRKKGPEDWELSSTNRSPIKAPQIGAEHLLGGFGGALSPMLFLMNPLYGAFIEQVEMKEGEKMSLFGAGVIKVGAKEKFGGREGFACKLFTKMEDKDVLTWEWTVDLELALPIKSITYENGKEKTRCELVSYKKD